MTFANDEVLKFYRELPFNTFGDLEEHKKNIKSGVSLRNHPPLLEILSNQTRVLEVGCGVGWLSAQIADRFRTSVTSIDFNKVAVDMAQESADALKIAVDYQVADLFYIALKLNSMYAFHLVSYITQIIASARFNDVSISSQNQGIFLRRFISSLRTTPIFRSL